MSGWHREHPELAGTDADPWMANPAHAAAAREVAMYERFPNLDGMIAEAEERFGSVPCVCGHRYDEHDQDPPGGGHCDRCGCEGHEEADEPEFSDCGRGRSAMLAGCRCDACTCAGDDEYHRRKGC